MATESDRDAERETERDAERWLRSKGLPYFVPARAWGDRLALRIAPFLVFLLLVDVSLSGLIRVHLVIDEESDALALLYLLLVALLALAVVAVPIVVAVISAALLRRFPGAGIPVTVALLIICVVGTPFVAGLTGSGIDFWAALVVNLGAVALAALLTWVGIGSLLGSAARTALRQLAAIGTLATRALPILMLVVVFAFFSRPLWEVTSTMQPARIVAVGIFFIVLGLLFAVPITRTEMRALNRSISPDDRVRSVREAGLPELESRAAGAVPPLGRIERTNIEAGFVLALGFQALIFAVLTCVFLLVLGALAFSSEVLEEWVGSRATTLTLFGVEFPFTWALLKTAIFLSCVSSLNFLVSVTTNSGYRKTFYEPLFHEARVALSVRAAYRGTVGGVGVGAADGADGDRPQSESGGRHAAAPVEPTEPDDDDESDFLGMPETGMVEPGRGSE
ncbi:hypothetical protein N1027_02655 [Herbiconiux sp. CPCC 205763]|uniref:Integral membrane protein n=1 Tax=Herbiconiux aconitum TaxID=2970913 RepID=A0ABT2GLD8_9MICO|nr:hypothetical protein [Herbiconiux aconitum]MCS5717028.1 hypothetical protein [Herbiconiux aconitum]